MFIPVTLLYGGLNALLVVILGLNVSRLRGKNALAVDTPLDRGQLSQVRAHGNAAEWIPLGIVMLLILELSGAGALTLHVLGGLFLAARLLHALGFLTSLRTSAAGATLNYFVILAMGGLAVFRHFK